jgi:hypothetical protein
MGILMDVKWVKAVLVVAFIGAFALATNHCRLEVLEGLEFLVCCSHDGESEPATPHQDDDCETDGCASLEGGLYKSEDGRVTSAVPLLSLNEGVLPDADAVAPTLLSAAFRTVAPPDLPTRWQFLVRAASAPRAPSLAS